MKTIIVKNQAEWDALPYKFAELTAVHVYSDPEVPLNIKRTPERAEVCITEKSLVDVSDSATIGYVSDSATIGYVSDSATIGKAHDNSMFRLCSDGVKIEAYNAVVIVCQDCKPTIKRHGAGVSVVHTKTMKHTVKSFAEIYGNGTKPLTLYKSVKDDFCDHRTGAIKYEGTVECPDWDPNPGRQCGGGLHLSPTPEMALSYHDGKVLECLAERKDIVVYATDITKVRCRKVTVVGEWKA